MKSLPQIQGWMHPHLLYQLQKDFPNVLLNLRDIHGDIFLLNLGIRRVLVLSHPEYARHVLIKRPNNYTKQGELNTPLRAVVADGIVIADGAEWRRRRTALQPAFARPQIEARFEAMAAIVTAVLDALGSPSNASLDIETSNAIIHRTTALLALQTLCSHPIDVSLADAMRSAYAATEQRSRVGTMLLSAIAARIPDLLSWREADRRSDAQDLLDHLTDALMQRCESADEGVLSALQRLWEHESSEANRQRRIQNELRTLFVAGYATTSAGLMWTIQLLLEHPHTLKAVQQEIDGTLNGCAPTWAMVNKLPLLDALLNESLRLYPPAWRITRTACNEDRIADYRVPQGVSVLIHLYAIHRHPAFWQQPDEFNPDRFMNVDKKGSRNPAWLPFGAGSRLCLGRDLALAEMKLILITLLQRFHLSLNGSIASDTRFATTLQPARPLPLQLMFRA